MDLDEALEPFGTYLNDFDCDVDDSVTFLVDLRDPGDDAIWDDICSRVNSRYGAETMSVEVYDDDDPDDWRSDYDLHVWISGDADAQERLVELIKERFGEDGKKLEASGVQEAFEF